LRVITSGVLSAALVAVTVGGVARAHFVFVLPDEEGTQARVILSETLELDENVDPALVDGVKLVTRDGAGAEGALTLARDGETRLVKLPEKTRGAIHGTLTHGIMKHGPKPFLVVYHPKACLGYPFGSAGRIGAESPAEIVPAGHPGAVRFQLLARGEPVAEAKMIVLLPNGKQQEVVTDAKGHTPVFAAAGRYGAWARHVVAKPGEHSGEAYVEERHYPTLVLDVPVGHSGAAKDTHATLTKTEKLPWLAGSREDRHGHADARRHQHLRRWHDARRRPPRTRLGRRPRHDRRDHLLRRHARRDRLEHRRLLGPL
jgi:hypothetical protein